MKEVCDRTGLTDRAVRLYIENGLLSPTRESSASGRKTILFSDEDVEILRTIAVLRQADFSLADIRDMLSDAQRIPGILADHREKLAEEIADRQRILQTLENIGPEEAADCAAVARAISRSGGEQAVHCSRHRVLPQRLLAWLALLIIAIGTVYFLPMAIQTAFVGEIQILVGGGYQMKLAFSWQAAAENWLILLAGGLFPAVMVLQMVYLRTGSRALLYAGGGLCLLIGVLFLFLSAETADQLYLHEFIRYRHSFMYDIIRYRSTAGFEAFLRMLKFVPPVLSAGLAAAEAVTVRKTMT